MLVVHRVNVMHSLFLALTCAAPAMGFESRSAAEELTVEGIMRQHQIWKESFTSLRMVYEWSNSAKWLERTQEPDPDVSLDEHYVRIEWITADPGWFRQATREYVAGVQTSLFIFGDDGEKSYEAHYQNPESVKSELPTSMEIKKSEFISPPKRSILGFLQPLQQVRFHTWWLNEYDQKVPFVIERTEELDGARCAVIRQPKTAGFSVWFDLDHDALPRRIEPDTTENSTRFHVEEFRKLANGHWFAGRGTCNYGGGDSNYWKVIEVKVNEPSPQSRFGVPKTNGKTRLTDMVGGKFSNIPHLATGPASSVKSVDQQTAKENFGPPPAKELENSWFWFLLGGGTTWLLLALAWNRRRTE